MPIKFARIREVQMPVRGTKNSAGIDLFVPKFTPDFIKVFNSHNTNAQSMCLFNEANHTILVRPNGQVFIPSGLKVDFGDLGDSALIAFN
jgi:hypothetical protein